MKRYVLGWVKGFRPKEIRDLERRVRGIQGLNGTRTYSSFKTQIHFHANKHYAFAA
jgi:hypothetical protein